MSLLLNQLFKFFKLLNSETGTNQIAAGLALGVVLGFSPFFSLQTFIVLFLVFFLRIQMGAAFLAAFFFKFIAYLFDPILNQIGIWVLEQEKLEGLFTTLYQMPIVPYTRFNNSIVMGSGVATLVLAPVLFFVFKYLIQKYREQILARFRGSKLWKAMSATSLYKLYSKYDNLYGN